MGERGAVAFLVSAGLLLIFGMAAIAIDVGAAFTERRSNQTAADTAAVAGMLWWSVIGTTSNTLQEGLDEAKEIANANTALELTQAVWDACVDPDALSLVSSDPALGLVGGSPCISWNEGFTTMRVRLPMQPTGTTFGRVLGVITLFTSAEAEASISGLGLGGSLPSGALGTAGGGSEICIKTGTGSASSESCGAPSTGDFQNFRPYFYTEVDPTINPTSKCTSGEQTDPISRTFADGIDHYFSVAPSLDGGLRENGSECPGFAGPAFPDHVESAAGYQNLDITQGLVLGGDWDGPFAGRLERGPYLSNPAGTTPNGFEIFDRRIDNRPLWSYIDETLSLHDDCAAVAELPDNPEFSTTSYTVGPNSVVVATWDESKTLMKQCLLNQVGPMLDLDEISQSPRLASVPRFWEEDPCDSNSCLYDIKDFVPVFIQDMWTAHSSSWTCSGEVIWVEGDHCRHQPGMTGEIHVAAPGQKRVDSASAYVLKCDHFSETVCREVQNSTGGTTTVIFNIRLTR